MDVVFETSDGRRLEEEIWFLSTVLQMKEILHKKYGFPISRQTFFFKGNIMKDERDTEYYKVIQGSRILLRLEPEPEQEPKPDPPIPSTSMEKRVKVTVLEPLETKMRVEMEVNLEDNVSELKNELLRMTERIQSIHLPMDGYFFICKQNVMEENRSFRWNDVRSGDVIEIFRGSVTGGLL